MTPVSVTALLLSAVFMAAAGTEILAHDMKDHPYAYRAIGFAGVSALFWIGAGVWK